jgi:hypothetical protein
MDWIERWFGIAPDNGDGTLELLLVLIAAAALAVVVICCVPRWRAAALRFGRQLRSEVGPDRGS